jgi:5-carboxymethyl-2-hydroxymuconate isomerase
MSTVKLKSDKEYTVGKVVCVGQNYMLHIEELNSKRSKDPLLFLKPSTAILHEGEQINLPAYSNDVHHEVELALLVGKKAKNIQTSHWIDYIVGVGIALDLTLRDLQREAKKNGHPWSVCKGFDGSLPISEFVPLAKISDIQALTIQLDVNDSNRQTGSTADMIWSVAELLAFITKIFTMEPGDVILTGTPAGVGKLHTGDHLRATITEIGSMEFKVA